MALRLSCDPNQRRTFTSRTSRTEAAATSDDSASHLPFLRPYCLGVWRCGDPGNSCCYRYRTSICLLPKHTQTSLPSPDGEGRGAPTPAPDEPITTVPDGRAPSGDGRSHRGSGLASVACAHHPRMAEAEAPGIAPSEPTTAVSDGRTLSTPGTSHEAPATAPAADPGPPALAPNEPPSQPFPTAILLLLLTAGPIEGLA